MKHNPLLAAWATASLGPAISPAELVEELRPMRKLGSGVFDWKKRNRGSIACKSHHHEREIARRLRQGAVS